jgi:hypothetical protein
MKILLMVSGGCLVTLHRLLGVTVRSSLNRSVMANFPEPNDRSSNHLLCVGDSHCIILHPGVLSSLPGHPFSKMALCDT